MSSDAITNNPLLYFALAFLPVQVAKWKLFSRARGAEPSEAQRAYVRYQVGASVWILFVLGVIWPLMTGHHVFWWPWVF